MEKIGLFNVLPLLDQVPKILYPVLNILLALYCHMNFFVFPTSFLEFSMILTIPKMAFLIISLWTLPIVEVEKPNSIRVIVLSNLLFRDNNFSLRTLIWPSKSFYYPFKITFLVSNHITEGSYLFLSRVVELGTLTSGPIITSFFGLLLNLLKLFAIYFTFKFLLSCTILNFL